MFAVRHLLEAVVEILNLGLTIYMWLIVARAILSWVNPDPYNPIVRFLYNATEPVLGWVRRRVPIVFGGLDLSPILVLLAIVFLQKFLVASLIGPGFRILLKCFRLVKISPCRFTLLPPRDTCCA